MKKASVSKISNMVKQASALLIIPATIGAATADVMLKRYAAGLTRKTIRNADLKLQLVQEQQQNGKSKRNTPNS